MRNILFASMITLWAFSAHACERPMFAPNSAFAKALREEYGKQDAATSKKYWAENEKIFQAMHDKLEPLCTDNAADENSCLASCAGKSKEDLSRATYVENGKHYALSADERRAVTQQLQELEDKWESSE